MSTSTTEKSENAGAPLDNESLVRLLREELIKTQLIVLDLNDRVLEKETDKADAIAILGQVELVLEQKINYISELDKALNRQIADLRQKLQSSESEREARDGIIQDLANRLETANQEVSKMHGVAGDFARDLAHTREALSVESAKHQQTRAELAARSGQLEAKTHALAATETDLAATRADLEKTQGRLAENEASLANERRRLATIFKSALWRLGRPWRALFGPKV